MNRRKFFAGLAGAIGLGIGSKAKAGQLHKEGCSYCGKQEYTVSGAKYTAIEIDLEEKGKRTVCSDCLLKLFDRVLL
jgi:hypothetical protein